MATPSVGSASPEHRSPSGAPRHAGAGETGTSDEADAGDPPSFEDQVGAVLDALRPGELVTYGEVAEEAGHPGAARAVGRLLATSDGVHPWWRVVTSTGRLVPGNEVEHARRLGAEGHAVVDGHVRLSRR